MDYTVLPSTIVEWERLFIILAIVWNCYELFELDRLLKWWRVKRFIKKIIYLFIFSALFKTISAWLAEEIIVGTTLVFFILLGYIIRTRRVTLAAAWNKYHETEDTDVFNEGLQAVHSATRTVEDAIKKSQK